MLNKFKESNKFKDTIEYARVLNEVKTRARGADLFPVAAPAAARSKPETPSI